MAGTDKTASLGERQKALDAALAQIEKMNYVETLLDDGMTTILKYGVSCYKKKCRIQKA